MCDLFRHHTLNRNLRHLSNPHTRNSARVLLSAKFALRTGGHGQNFVYVRNFVYFVYLSLNTRVFRDKFRKLNFVYRCTLYRLRGMLGARGGLHAVTRRVTRAYRIKFKSKRLNCRNTKFSCTYTRVAGLSKTGCSAFDEPK